MRRSARARHCLENSRACGCPGRQKISDSANLSSEEKEEIFDEALDLYYEDGVSLDEISEVFDQNDNYNDINSEFSNLDDLYDDRDDDDDDDRDDDDDDDRDDD